MNDNLSKKILKKIEEKKIKPKSKWLFVLKNYVFWIVTIFATFVLTFLFVSLFSHLQHIDFSIAEKVSGGKMRHLFLFFPYSLLFLILIIFILGIENFLHTKYAYRIEVKKILFSIFLIAVVLAGTLSFFVDAEKIEHSLEKVTFGMYHNGNLRRKQMWVQPQHGLLAGSLLEFKDDNKQFEFIDFSGKIWTVDIADFTDKDISILNNSEYISLQGKQEWKNRFKACFISEWKKRKMFRKSERNYFELRSNKCN